MIISCDRQIDQFLLLGSSHLRLNASMPFKLQLFSSWLWSPAPADCHSRPASSPSNKTNEYDNLLEMFEECIRLLKFCLSEWSHMPFTAAKCAEYWLETWKRVLHLSCSFFYNYFNLLIACWHKIIYSCSWRHAKPEGKQHFELLLPHLQFSKLKKFPWIHFATTRRLTRWESIACSYHREQNGNIQPWNGRPRSPQIVLFWAPVSSSTPSRNGTAIF